MKGPFFNALANLKIALAVILVYAFIMTMLNIYLNVKLANVPRDITYHMQHCDGGIEVVDPFKTSPVVIDNFVTGVWSKLTNFPENGATDSVKALKEVSQYLSPAVIEKYKNSIESIKNDGYLENYVVSSIALPSDPEKDVKPYGKGWLVKKTFILRFYYAPEDENLEDTKNSDGDNPVELRIEKNMTFKVDQYPNDRHLAITGLTDKDISTKD